MGKTVIDVVRQFGTPVFIYDEERLKKSYKSLRDTLPKELTLYYSMKANPNPRICKHMLEAGSPLEVASIGEYRAAVRSGAVPGTIIFTGPGKGLDELTECLRGGIYAINAESVQELELIGQIANRLGIVAPVLLRVNLDIAKHGSRMASGGSASQFGIDEEQLPAVIDRLLSMTAIRWVGLHTYQGTQNFNLDFYRESIPAMFDLCRDIRGFYGIQLSALGFGGGFGVPAFIGDEPFPVSDFGKLIAEEAARNADLGLDMLFVESGRFLTAEMGVYVASVLYTKESYGKRYAILDGGTHHRAFSSLMGRSFKKPLPVKVVRKDGTCYTEGEITPSVAFSLAGKLCTPTDVLHGGACLSIDLSVGDCIVFPCAGAYGLSSGNVHFLSHELPMEVMISGGDDERMQDVSWMGAKGGTW